MSARTPVVCVESAMKLTSAICSKKTWFDCVADPLPRTRSLFASPCPALTMFPRSTRLPTVSAGHGEAKRSEEHTSELQSLRHLVCRLLLEKKKHNADWSII